MDTTNETEWQRAQRILALCNGFTADWVNTFLKPRQGVDHVEGYVIMAAVFMIALAIGTPRRRHSHSFIMRYGIEGVFILSFPLISYTLGLMQGQVIKSELYPVWGMFLAILFAGTNSMSVQKLDEYKQSMKLYCDCLLFMFYVGAVLGIFIHEGKTIFGEGGVTLEKIWSDNIGVLSSSSSPPICHLKDLCLSFSLFHLVVRRYFGYTCSESKLDKTRVLVLDGLLQTEQECERAFQVIEAEMAFLYDFFFTKYAFIMYGREGNSHIEKLILLLGKPPRWLRYWRNNIGQYSVLDFFSSSDWDQVVQQFHSRKAGKPIELSMEVKRAVARTIKNSINGHLSSGISTLMKHDMNDELCWACQVSDEFTVTHIILVWHIATIYCEISETVRHPDENAVHPNQVVATSLSKYCAHLVAFAPGLLPGSSVESEGILDELVAEAKEAFQNLAQPREKYEKFTELHNVGLRGSTTYAKLLTKGVVLGKALESMENRTTRWDLLADFWAEMMVYIAPSSNVSGHIELLAQGGEFVTHVWALLMHAGILERPSAAATVP